MIPNIFSVIHISLYNFKADYGSSRTKATTVGASILKRALLRTARLSPRVDVARMGEYESCIAVHLREEKNPRFVADASWRLPLEWTRRSGIPDRDLVTKVRLSRQVAAFVGSI